MLRYTLLFIFTYLCVEASFFDKANLEAYATSRMRFGIDIQDVVQQKRESQISHWGSIIPMPNTLSDNHMTTVRVPIALELLKEVADKNYIYAYLSHRIYTDTSTDLKIEKDGWILVDIDENNSNGFKAGLYMRPSNPPAYVIAYGGTTATSSKSMVGKTYDTVADLLTDISLLGIVSSSQPKNALDFYKHILPIVGSYGKLECITGHSLGGSLAQYTGLYGGVKTVTFNTAPLAFNWVASKDIFQDKVMLVEDKGMKHVHFKYENKLSNIMLQYDPISTLSTAMMHIDESNVGYLMAVRLLWGIPMNQKLDYLIIGEKIYLENTGQEDFLDFSNHSIPTIQKILKRHTTYTYSFDLEQKGSNTIAVVNQQLLRGTQNVVASSYKWEAYLEGEKVASGEGLDTITDLEEGDYSIKIYALLPNALWVSNEKEISL